ncbi:MAG: type II secretion system F family protein [Acidimicrobiia bacterium]
MTLAVAIVCGAGVGLAFWLAARALAPPLPSLTGALDDLERPRPLRDGITSDTATASLPAGAGGALVRVGAALGIDPSHRVLADLELVDRSYERHLLDKLLTGAAGFALPVIGTVGLGAAGLDVPLPLVVVSAVVLAAGGFFVPDVVLRAEVERRQAEFTQTFSLYLDLVSLVLAGGGGVETALLDAAEAGDGWSFQRLRAALAGARLAGRTPWEAFADLGERLRVPALAELAGSVTLAGEKGAKVRASLVAKAGALRQHQVREAEAEAEAASERMTIPLVLLVCGFMLLIGYPAVQRVFTSL